MPGFTLAAVASIAAGLSIGAAVAVGATLAIEGHSMVPAQDPPTPVNVSGPLPLNYGDRCFHGHCIPWP